MGCSDRYPYAPPDDKSIEGPDPALREASIARCVTFLDYTAQAMPLAMYPNRGSNPIYPALGLIGEIGEVAEQIKKMMRDDGGELSPDRSLAIVRELGDVLWYVTAVLTEAGAVPTLAGLVGVDSLIAYSQSDSDPHGDEDPARAIFMMTQGACRIADAQLEIERPEGAKHMARNGLYRVLRGLDRLTRWTGHDLVFVAQENLRKLYRRRDMGTLGGSGSER